MSGLHDMPDALAVRMEWMGQWASALSTPMTPIQRQDGLQVVMGRLAARQRRRSLVLGVSLLGMASAAAAGLVLVRSVKHLGGVHGGQQTAGAIAYRIEGGEIGDSGYIRSFDSNGSLLRFAEGTELRLMTGARGRLSSVDARGARLAIEEGEAEVKVTPRPGARWLVDAGPFLITVKGTVFTAAWDGATEQLDIRMKKGLISVSGPFADGVMAVRAGQHLAVNMRKHEVLLRQMDPTELGADEASEADGAAADGDSALAESSTDDEEAEGAPAARSAGGSDGARAHAAGGLVPGRWAAALAVGDLDSILHEARRHGWRRSMAHARSEDLAALADAARYRRRNDIAREALLTERLRFPKSERASDAAFLLGRLEESKWDDNGRALEWYDVYLKEAPSGAYSSEALGRKMTATQRLQGATAARQIADEYLRRFPKGTYAGAARALLSGS